MLDGLGLGWEQVGQITPSALVGLWFLLVLLGRMPTPGQMNDLRSQLADARADRDHYRASVDTLEQAVLKQGMTLERLLTLAETSTHALTAIQTGLHRPEDYR